MKSKAQEGFYYIAGHGRGWAFSASDLTSKFTREEADNLLSDLRRAGKIRRVARGIYDYPKYSEILKQDLSPNIDAIARAYARKFNWTIEASGETALNLLGVSTQVPGKYLYLSNGPSKSYKILNKISLEFKKSTLKDIGFRYTESSLITQALKSLGKEQLSQSTIAKIKNKIDPKMYSKIKKDTKSTTSWVYEVIKEICEEE